MKTLNVQMLHWSWARRLILLHLCFLASVMLMAQHTDHQAKGSVDMEEYYTSHPGKCLEDAQREAIQNQLDENIAKLKAEGKLHSLKSSTAVVLDWPLRVKPGLGYNNYYYIIGYVDHGGVEDYNCGGRTYNGHDGTDIVTWPFPWYIYDNDYVEVIAAQAGTIIGKRNGNPDKNCSWGVNDFWNAVYIQHADGTVAWYGHLKNGSLTSKAEGATVAKGEYLGSVASSGKSDRPHLHFEIHDTDGSIIDPYTGGCNGYNSESWWASQQSYRVPTLNAILTHSAVPNHDCDDEQPNLSNQFAPGETVYAAVYFRDYLNGDVSSFRLRRPDNTVWDQWQHTSIYNAPSNKYWWWWNKDIPTNEQQGMWTLEVDYKGQTFSHQFYYGTGTPPPPAEECPEDLTVTNYSYSNANLQAANTIDCSAVVASGDDVKCHAGTLVRLTPGFHAQAGSDFHAYIEGCETNQDDCEVLSNSNFDFDSGDWTTHGNYTTSYNGGTMSTNIANPGVNSWDLILRQSGVTLEANKNYNISIRAKADADRTVILKTILPDPYTTYMEQTISLTTSMQTFTFPFPTTSGTNAAFTELLLGGNNANIQVDFISITEEGCATTPPPAQTCELLTNTGFDNGFADWTTWGGTHNVTNGIATYTGLYVGTNAWDIGLNQGDLTLEAGKTYTLTFKARGSQNRPIQVRVIKPSPYYSYYWETINLTTNMNTYEVIIEAEETYSGLRLDFLLAVDNANVYIDDVSLTTDCNNKLDLDNTPDIQIYPNPANHTINVAYELPESTTADIMVFDALGKLVKNPTNVELLAGQQALNMDISDLTSGMYFYTLQADTWKATKKFIIAR